MADKPIGQPRGRAIGRYLVIDSLGAGGMGEVFSAYDPELDRRMALKLLRLGPRRHVERSQARLLREAQALAKLSHPNVVAVFDAGTHAGRVFVAMEYVEGVTLGTWLEAEARPWKAVIGVLVEAGRGLAAAHVEGLVHRDFKPSNVMVGPKRVCVLDFGLARRADEVDSLSPPSGEVSSGSLTETGTVMGTPKFMAPEQFAQRSIDARTDQFAFCVVAWRALYGQPPFPGESFAELSFSVQFGSLTPPPSKSAVPRAVRLALERGLSLDPDRRFPDMDELLAVLQHATRRRRRFTIAGAAAVLLAVGALAIAVRDEPPCRDLSRALASVWDEDRRQQIANAFAAADVPYAAFARERVEQAFDAYASEWVRQRTDACQATRTRGESQELDLRTACLDARLHELGALTEILATADAGVIEHAVTAARNLPPLSACSERLADAPPPTDPAIAFEVARLRADLARVHVEVLTGRFDVGAAECDPVLQRARELDDPPLLAEAAVALGHIEENRGRPEAAIASYEEALWAAVAGGHWRVEAEALIGLASVMSNHTQEPEAALRQLRHARAVLQRMGDPEDLLARLWLYSGTAYLRMRRFDEAEDEYRKVIEATGDRPEMGQVRLAALSNMAASRGERGRYREATEAIVEAVELSKATVGAVHPLVGKLYNNLGATYARMGNGPEAIANQRKALAIYEACFGDEHPEVGRAHHNLGVGLAATGDDEAALASYRKALAIKRAALGPDDPSVAHSANNCGDALVRLGRPAEAIPLLEEALRIWALQPGRASPDAAYALSSLTDARLALGDPQGAVASAREALALSVPDETDPIQLARTRFVAARAMVAAGEDRQEAIDLATRAREGFLSPERDSSRELARVDEFLAAQALR